MAGYADLLFEIGTEELPAGSINRLCLSLKDSFIDGLSKAHLSHGEIHQFATPRRIALLVKACALQQNDYQIAKRGPALSAAFDHNGNPTKAALGFARSCGQEVSDLQTISTDEGSWLYYLRNEAGREAATILPDIIKLAIEALPISKRMRWGETDTSFIRPVHWVLFIHGNHVVSCEILGLRSSNITYGHRFHYPGPIEISLPSDYESLLLEPGCVVADFNKRKALIIEQLENLAKNVGAKVDADEELLSEVTNLTERPVAIMGSFDKEYLKIPQEALIQTMKVNQKYFSLFDEDNNLLSNFITIANIQSNSPDIVLKGNERVVRPRLSDAKFFWQYDINIPLHERLEDLKQLVFYKGLGTVYDKTQRVITLAKYIGSALNANDEYVTTAATLSRCDLTTKMVFEFPELQGIIGSYIAIRSGEHREVANALYEFYLPKRSGDRLPVSSVSIAVNLADKLDTLVSFFSANIRPTGEKDPYALRRTAISILRILGATHLNLSLSVLFQFACNKLHRLKDIGSDNLIKDLNDFMQERLKYMCLEDGYTIELFNAVIESPYHSIYDFNTRADELKKFSNTIEFSSLASAIRRIKNIIKDKKLTGEINPSIFSNQYEISLYTSYKGALSPIDQYLMSRDYTSALHTLFLLNSDINRFLDNVIVNTDDIDVSNNRALLLAAIYKTILLIADVSLLIK